MAEQQPNPLLAGFLGMVQDRQVQQAAELDLLGQLVSELRALNRKTDRLLEIEEEWVRMTRER